MCSFCFKRDEKGLIHKKIIEINVDDHIDGFSRCMHVVKVWVLILLPDIVDSI